MSAPTSTPTTKPRPALFRALGRNEPPAQIELKGAAFNLRECLKHDSWAATAIYENAASVAICKFNRQQSILGVPMTWLGRRLAAREARLMAKFADIPHVPRDCGDVRAGGRVWPNAVAHWYIPGHPLRHSDNVPDDFFPRLRATLDEIHKRGTAYVDLHKRENIIVAEDGTPVLIDFQICQSLPRGFLGRIWPTKAAIRTLQRIDDYHLMKHIIRCRPDLLPPEDRDIDKHRPRAIKVFRMIGNPARFVRRRLLVLAGVRAKGGRAQTEVAPEDAFRTP
jgi:hypothetical protein